jgi:hypothetical protein
MKNVSGRRGEKINARLIFDIYIYIFFLEKVPFVAVWKDMY